ncbi:hypothetical protein GCM10007036_12720 [Alsobacter metallidurans]|uniref:Phage portal protein n=1 Tax=Alsobacter metallidurans TaxID=340221 RepID=A0A917I5Y2_9HYPH|nr:hypothetical protein GCM10007036_12720 [Alsobacter metallidurans]
MTPKDMHFIQAKAAAAREIALAFGVPPMLLGLPGDNTYSNYAEANRSFWRQTARRACPARRIQDSLDSAGHPHGREPGPLARPRLRRRPSPGARPRRRRRAGPRARSAMGAHRRGGLPHG